jgi:hypothetical protein
MLLSLNSSSDISLITFSLFLPFLLRFDILGAGLSASLVSGTVRLGAADAAGSGEAEAILPRLELMRIG